MKDFWKRLYPGMRTIKTALAIIVILLLYQVGDYFGIADRGDAFLACVSGLICMRDSVEKSVSSGISRLWGTLIGAILGLIYLLIDLANEYYVFNILIMAAGIIVLIVLCNVFHLHDSVIIGCVVFLFITLQQTDIDPLIHSIRRFVDTGIGIGISIGINHFVLNPKNKDTDDLTDEDL